MRDWCALRPVWATRSGLLVAGLLLGCGEAGPGPASGDGLGAGAGVGASSGTGSSSAGVGGQASGAGGANHGVGGGVTSSGSSASSDCSVVDTAPTVLRRLSALEYRLTTQDLLALPEPPEAAKIPLDNERLGFRTFAEYQTMSAENLRGYLETAAGLASSLLSDSARREQVIGCELAQASCLADFVERFGKLAYRRPLEAVERDAIVDAAMQSATSEQDQFAFVIEALLSSANFLYRVEIGDNPDGLARLSPTELASKLSFALWGRGPSEAQLDAAAEGALDTEEGLRAEVTKMLADERTEVFFEQFFRQWLGYQTLKPPSAAEEQVFADMQAETDALLSDFAWDDGGFLGAFTADYTYASSALADFYGLPAPDFLGRVDFPLGHPRANSGILTHAALLSAKGDGDLISIRGNWVLRTFLCEEIHLPPDLADTIGELLVGLDRVGIVEARNTRTECRGCHALLDPVGIGFAAFDRTGVFDETIDPTIFGIDPALPLAPEPNTFENIAELSAQLASMPEVPHCLAERAYLYVNGREPTRTDDCSVERTSETFVGGGESFRSLLSAVATDPAFRLRRAPAPGSSSGAGGSASGEQP